jgi:hypothetical protein
MGVFGIVISIDKKLYGEVLVKNIKSVSRRFQYMPPEMGVSST